MKILFFSLFYALFTLGSHKFQIKICLSRIKNLYNELYTPIWFPSVGYLGSN